VTGVKRVAALSAVAALAILPLAGCGGDREPEGGTATVLMVTAPDYLDPQAAFTTEGAEAGWISYTPLLTYRHKPPPEGDALIPGLAESLPEISASGRRYSFTLREGLVYANGEPVRASDFPYTIERALRLNWGGKRFLTDNIVGAKRFDRGDAATISGITADDATRAITVELRRPYGAFANVLGLPATGLVPRGTPMRDLSGDPPPGVGAYEIKDVVPNKGWSMVRNRRFADLDLPNIPEGDLERIVVRIEPNARAAVEQVLSGRADNLDPGTPLPGSALPRIEALAEDRFERAPVASTLYFFLNTTNLPFSNELARRAVLTGLNRPVLAMTGGGFTLPECYLLPDGITGHPGDSCPYGDPDADGDLPEARRLVQQSGTRGQQVTVWGQDRGPYRGYTDRYVKLLNRIGYRATARIVPSSAYFRMVGSASTNPQTGFAIWFNDFPNPSDFYRVLDANTIQPTDSANLGRVRDVFIQQQLEKLNLVPAQDLATAAGDWRDLDEYTAKKAYAAVFGTQAVPKLMSERIDFHGAVVHPLFLSDWSSWSLRR
jgi:peptide/nickel transport system substrate-binding protein